MNLLRRRPILSGVLLIIAAVALGLGWNYLRARHAVSKYRRALIAAGEKLSVKELLPPAIPPAANGASLFLKAQSQPDWNKGILSTNPPSAMPMSDSGHAWVRWQQEQVVELPEGKVSNSWEEVEAALDPCASRLAYLDELAGMETIDFDFDYFQGFYGLLPQLAPMKGSCQLLGYAAVTELHRGNPEAAFNHLRGLLALARANTEERLIISQLVRIAIATIGATVTWEFLQSPNVTDAQLAQLQADWSRLEFPQAMEKALMMERAISEMTLDDMRESSDTYDRVVTGFGGGGRRGSGGTASGVVEHLLKFTRDTAEGTVERSKEAAWRVAWSYPDQLRMLQGHQVLIEAMREVRRTTNFLAAMTRQEQRLEELGFSAQKADQNELLFNSEADLRTLFSSGVKSVRRVGPKVMRMEAARVLVITAIALKRFAVRHGRFPAELSELTPEFLAELPIDPIDGRPMRYQPETPDRYKLYSIGEDGVDNGGDAKAEEKKASSGWLKGEDWGWPEPLAARGARAATAP